MQIKLGIICSYIWLFHKIKLTIAFRFPLGFTYQQLAYVIPLKNIECNWSLDLGLSHDFHLNCNDHYRY